MTLGGFIHLPPGGAVIREESVYTYGWQSEPDLDEEGIIFADDDSSEYVHWFKFVPTALRSASPLTLRLTFKRKSSDSGNARIRVRTRAWKEKSGDAGNYEGGTINTDELTVNLSAAEHGYVDLDISSYLTVDDEFIDIELRRLGTDGLDTMTDDLYYKGGRTLEISP